MVTILIVEDSADSRRPLARLLRSRGYETLCAKDGEEAVEALRFTKPGLILLDLMMPVMGGLEFLRILRHDFGWVDVPVIVVTAVPEEDETVREAKRLGARECLVKADYSPDELFTSIRRHLTA